MKLWPTKIENKCFVKSGNAATVFYQCLFSVFAWFVSFWWATLSFFFLLNIYVSWYIYCYTDATIFSQLLIGTIAIVPKVFFFFFNNRFVFFFLLNIYVSWYIYCYIDTTNFTIFSQLLTCQFLTSRNKIIKYETVTNHNWK